MRVHPFELSRPLEASIGDRSKEPEFFRTPLDATAFVHAPKGDRSGRVRFVQLHAPNGELLLPFFSDYGKADVAARATYASLRSMAASSSIAR